MKKCLPPVIDKMWEQKLLESSWALGMTGTVGPLKKKVFKRLFNSSGGKVVKP